MKFRLVVAMTVLAFGACDSKSSGSSSSADTQSAGSTDTSGGTTDTSVVAASDATSGAGDTSTTVPDTSGTGGTGSDVIAAEDSVIPSDDDAGTTDGPLTCSGILQCVNKCPQTNQTDFNLCMQDCVSQSDTQGATAFQDFLKCQTTACKDATTTELLQVCMQEKCSDQIYACFAAGDLTCKEFSGCLSTCKAGDQACQAACFEQASPLAGKTYDQITACIQKACPAPATQECANTQINPGGACVDVYAACDAGTEYVDPGTTDGGTGSTDGGTGSTDGGTGATDGTIPPPAMPAFNPAEFQSPAQYDGGYWKMIPSFHAR
jgi:hypothetical protein